METPERNPDNCTLEEAERTIHRWDSAASEDARERMIFDGDRQEADLYLQAVDKIQRRLSSISIGEDDEKKSHASIQIAMVRLEDEFRRILLSQVTAIDFESLSGSLSCTSSFTDEDDYSEGGTVTRADSTSSSYRSVSGLREIDMIRPESIADLRAIAKRMIAAGFSRECVQVYVNARKPSVDACFVRLGVERLSIGDVQRLELVDLEGKTRRWIRAAKSAVRIVFAAEKRLCETVFPAEDSRDVSDACFIDTVKASAITLFNFAEAISISRRAPEKLFKILDLHDALTDLASDIDSVFDSKAGESIRAQSGDIVSHLAEAARGILSEFENMVLREPSKATVPGGTLHPLTRYVMNYISLISDYKQTLGELIVSNPNTSADGSPPLTEFHVSESKSPLERHLLWIIVILQSNLEGKSKHYRNASLEFLFMMNNIHYIVEKVKGLPELREMVGDDYLRKLTAKFRQLATSYQRATWVRVLHCLRDEGIHVSGGFSSGVSKTVLRERFKSFNSVFEEVHRVQSTWLVPDNHLREDLRISMSETLIPAYRSFLGRYKTHIESTKHFENYLKYSVEDLETMLLDFFEGHSGSHHFRRRP